MIEIYCKKIWKINIKLVIHIRFSHLTYISQLTTATSKANIVVHVPSQFSLNEMRASIIGKKWENMPAVQKTLSNWNCIRLYWTLCMGSTKFHKLHWYAEIPVRFTSFTVATGHFFQNKETHQVVLYLLRAFLICVGFIPVRFSSFHHSQGTTLCNPSSPSIWPGWA